MFGCCLRQILALNDRIETANKDAFSLFAKRHYFNPEGLGTDVVVYPAPASSSSSASASSTAEPAAKKRKGGAGAGGAGGEATVNGESGTNSEEAHVYTGVVRTNEYVNKVHDDLR